ncbi:MAG TPA: hypothetical protein VLW51_03855 [Solirubrobacteraceae bacterium]|nr:hypothetical protein [Solirubrobacteraceae bacterium]
MTPTYSATASTGLFAARSARRRVGRRSAGANSRWVTGRASAASRPSSNRTGDVPEQLVLDHMRGH